MAEPLWWRTRWMEAVWSSDLKPMERFVACVYFDHARDQHHAWVTAARLTERTGLSRDAALRARKGLVEAGWIVVREKARQHRADVYELVIPDGASSTRGGPLPDLSSTGGVPLSDSRGTGDDTRGTGDVPNLSTYPSTHPSSSSRAVEIVFRAWPPEFDEDEDDDEREENRELHRETIAELLPGFLSENNVKAAIPWLETCAASGDLARNFEDYHDRVMAERRRELREARARQNLEEGLRAADQRQKQKIEQIAQAIGGSDPQQRIADAHHAIQTEARAMLMEHDPYCDLVLSSVLMAIKLREAS